MKQFALWLALIVAVGIAASLAVVHFEPASSALQQFVSPGPLSAAHAFLGSQCEACHTPDRGIEAASCFTCHGKDISNLREKPSTAFHTTINNCGGCHAEHQGGMRPTRMDHDVLLRIGLNSQPGTSRPTIMQDLVSSFGGAAPNGVAQHLACTDCHGDRDLHHGFFGRECAACHGTEAWSIAGYVHPPATSTACAQCHQPPASHYSGHFFGLSMAAGGVHVEQCYVCHKTISWRDRKAGGESH